MEAGNKQVPFKKGQHQKNNQSTVIFFCILNFTVKEHKVKNNCIFIVT